jgi:hypothetical protein
VLMQARERELMGLAERTYGWDSESENVGRSQQFTSCGGISAVSELQRENVSPLLPLHQRPKSR